MRLLNYAGSIASISMDRVSILVLVDAPLESYYGYNCCKGCGVSILVLVDAPLE